MTYSNTVDNVRQIRPTITLEDIITRFQISVFKKEKNIMNTDLFKLGHFAFTLPLPNVDTAVNFYSQVINAPTARSEDFGDWGVRFSSLGNCDMQVQHTWESEPGDHRPHVQFTSTNMPRSLDVMMQWCVRNGITQPVEVWSGGNSAIYKLDFLPYNIELSEVKAE